MAGKTASGPQMAYDLFITIAWALMLGAAFWFTGAEFLSWPWFRDTLIAQVLWATLYKYVLAGAIKRVDKEGAPPEVMYGWVVLGAGMTVFAASHVGGAEFMSPAWWRDALILEVLWLVQYGVLAILFIPNPVWHRKEWFKDPDSTVMVFWRITKTPATMIYFVAAVVGSSYAAARLPGVERFSPKWWELALLMLCLAMGLHYLGHLLAQWFDEEPDNENTTEAHD